MARPTEEQKRVSDRKREIVLNRIKRAGGAKRAIKPNISKKLSHGLLDEASYPFNREVECDQEKTGSIRKP
ncbi:MAG: hypothetical protein HY670_12310 [Chloroflexi bacterium]|nr:hypothetical protein [Chloroflexota bacterium]